MILSEISAALQRGETLTAEQKAQAIRALRGWIWVSSDHEGSFAYRDNAGTMVVWYSPEHDDPFVSLDAALAFVGEVFPRNHHYSKRLEELSDGSWLAAVPFSDGKGVDGFAQTTAPTPSAAIMAAAIEAFLAKGGE